MKSTSNGCEWVVACVSPWAVSKHPNFSAGELTPYGALAQLVEGRPANDDELGLLSSSTQLKGWEIELVKVAAASTQVETQVESVEMLWHIAEDRALPPGARVAAALFASVGEGELERSDIAARRLANLSESMALRPKDAHELVIQAALVQQWVLRLSDASQFSAALQIVRRFEQDLNDAKPAGPGSFSVSSGIGWSARRVVNDVLERFRNLHKTTLLALEPIESQAWVKVVRSRADWVQYRSLAMATEVSESLVDDLYRQKYESTRGTVRFGHRPAWSREYNVLLSHELSGDVGGIRRHRSRLAKAHLLSGQGLSDFGAAEAIRLLRHAQDHDTLKAVTPWVRDSESARVLLEDVKRVLERASRTRTSVEADLVLLGLVADLMDSEQLAQAIACCDFYLDTERRSGRRGWAAQDLAWSTIARLLSGSKLDEYISKKLFVEISAITERTSLETAYLRVMESLNWVELPDHELIAWRAWCTSNKQEAEERGLGNVLEFLTERVEPSRPIPIRMDLESSALAADGLVDVTTEQVTALAGFLASSLERERKDAERGFASFGGISTANVAVAFALRFGTTTVLQAVHDHLADVRVDASLKRLAFERIARNSHSIAPEWRDRLGHAARSQLRAVTSDPFGGGENLGVFPEALRAAAATQAISEELALSTVLGLAAQSDRGRLEAAKSVAVIAVGFPDATWAPVLLLSYTFDRDPQIRAEAAFGLPFLEPVGSQQEIVETRFRTLIESDGIRVAARGLVGIRAASALQRRWVRSLAPYVRELRKSSPYRVIRELADDALQDYSPA